MPGRTITLYIAGEDRKYIKTAELSQWTGKAFIGERKHTKLIQSLEELSVPGLYFLINDENDNNLLKKIYIGEADEVNYRIYDHYNKKDWWDKFIIFMSKDKNLTKAHVRYLEKSFYELSKKNFTTIELMNTNKPTGSKLPISAEDDMEIFKNNAIFILKNLGIIDFTQEQEKQVTKYKKDNLFYIYLTSDRKDENGNILFGKLTIVNGKYKLLKGSFIEGTERESFKNHNYYKLRKKIEKDNLLNETEYENIYKLKEDIDFPSASAAAAVVKNRATNGKKEWKLEDGTNLDDYENNLLIDNKQ